MTAPAQRAVFARRGFLKGVGLGSVAIPAAGLLGGSVALAEAPPKSAGPKVLSGEIPIKLRINGKDHELKVEPRTTLLNALRDKLDLTGSKLVCDRGTCGACSVIMDGPRHVVHGARHRRPGQGDHDH